MKTYVYIDAFNLYYGALKGTSYKWLDVSRLCRILLPKNQIEHIHYFTAPGLMIQVNRYGSRFTCEHCKPFRS